MKSYYLKAYYDGDVRNCRNYNSSSSNTICHYVIIRSEHPTDLETSNSSLELYSNSDFTNRYQTIYRPSYSDLRIIESNSTYIVDKYGGQIVGQSDSYLGSFIGIFVMFISWAILVWALLRRHL